MLKIGIVGTSDVQNLGDLLFPIIAELELERRLGPIEFHRFAYHAKRPPDWPFLVSSVSELPAKVSELDGLIVGGGHIVRFDKSIAPGYLPPTDEIHHPTGYWLMPALLAQHHGCPVVWNCPSASADIPKWSEPLMRAAFQNSSYIAVRDEASRDILIKFASDVAVVPDTCFGIARLVNPKQPSAYYLKMREAIGLTRPYIFVQSTSRIGGFGNFVRKNREHFASYQFLSIPIGPALGDSNFDIADNFEGLVTLASWPNPSLLAEFIAGASCVVGDSLHVAITSISFGVPVFRPGSQFDGKFAILEGQKGIHCFQEDGGIDPAWFDNALNERSQSPDISTALEALDLHWNRVAECISSKETRGPKNVLSPFVQQLPKFLENEERLLGEVKGLREQLEIEKRNGVAQCEDASVRLREMLGREAQVEALKATLSVRDIEIAALSSTVLELDNRVKVLNTTVQARENDILALHHSTSWRITAGLRGLKTIASRLIDCSAVLKFKSLTRARMNRTQYDWAFANGIFSARNARSLVATYPSDHYKTVKGYDGEKGYEYEARPLIHLGATSISFPDKLSDSWRQLAMDLLSSKYREALTALTGRDLMTVPMEAYVCHFGDGAWLGPHLDLKEKIVTHVLYFNEDWDVKNGGCLNILGSSNVLDCIAQVPPNVGNSSVLVRSNNSWHSVSKVADYCTVSRKSMNVIFYHPGSVSTMWPPDDKAGTSCIQYSDEDRLTF